MSSFSGIPLTMSATGLVPMAPTDILTQIITIAAAESPGYTANLPGSLIEDISSTSVAAVYLCNSALVDLVNSVSAVGANNFVLIQLGQMYGVAQGLDTNTSVYVVISGPPGYVINAGFTVSDGTYQYIIQDGGVIGTSGSTPPLYAVAALSGSWVVGVGTVTNIITQYPTAIGTLTVTNPSLGTPSPGAQTVEDYRAQVVQAGQASATGMTAYLRTAIQQVSGVQARLVAVRQVTTGWEVIVGGGDPYAIANAIFTSMFDLSILSGSVLGVAGITNANPGVMTTTLNHGFTSGQVIDVTGVTGMTGINSTPLTITVLTQTTFSLGINTTSSGTYGGGGVVTPNNRNTTVTIYQYPDIYTIPFVIPPLQTLEIVLVWNTNAFNTVSASAVAALGQPAIVSYINAIPVGAPINIFELQAVFQTAIASVIATPALTRMVFTISVNGIGVSPSAGTGIIAGDPESYFYITAAQISITQG
jgi:hypothetical protein